MQPVGLRQGLHQRLPCRSAALHGAPHPLRPLNAHHIGPIWTRASSGPADASGAASSSGSPGAAGASVPAPNSSALELPSVSAAEATSALASGPVSSSGAGAGDAGPAVRAASPAPGGADTSLAAAGSTLVDPAAPAVALPNDPGTLASSGRTPSGASNSSSTTTTTSGSGVAGGAAGLGSTSTPLSASLSSLPPFVQQLLAWLGSVIAAVQQFPAWVQAQHLQRLREACEEEPWDADRHAAYLAELVKTNPREVVARVEARRAAINGPVVVEYLKALIDTGRVSELVRADAAVSASAAAAAAAAASQADNPRTLSELLQHLQDQLALAHSPGGSWTQSPDSAPAAGGLAGSTGLGAAAVHSEAQGGLRSTAATAAAAAEIPGGSLRRPLHVVVTGLPPGVLQFASSSGSPSGSLAGLPATAAAAASASASSSTPLLLRPLALLWRLVTFSALIVAMAFIYLAGVQAIRRVQSSGGALVSPWSISPGPPAAAGTAGGSGSGNTASSSSPSGGGGGSPSVEPKEYKKDELPEKSIRTFKDVKGCDEAKEELREVVEFLKNPTKFTRLGAKLPKGVLLTGPPGTGKTLLAKAVAGEAGVPFFYRAGSEFEELYVGVGSRRMRTLFAAAKKRSPCIVFIDEIDAIGGNRKAWENHTRKTLNQLLVEMDGFESTEGIIVMAATNLPESLDPALKRPGRFDRQVAVPLPDIKGRRDILEYYLADKPLGPDVDRELLARQTQGFSGADLSNLINEGAILAAKEGSDAITQRMLDWAYDKILMGVERKSVKRTLEARRRTSFHEAGHALVALATPGACPIHKATIVPRGHALGMVTQVGREDEFSINRQQMLARIWVCMGGTVAEELVFGSDQVSSGATDDLRQATSMARHMVAECGMSLAIGPVYVAAHDERHGGAGVSEATRQRVDAEVAAILAEAKAGVKTLLSDRMQDLRTLAEALLDRETLTREEINALLEHSDQQTAQPPPGSGSDGSGSGGGTAGRDPRADDDVTVPAPAPAQVPAQVGVQSAVQGGPATAIANAAVAATASVSGRTAAAAVAAAEEADRAPDAARSSSANDSPAPVPGSSRDGESDACTSTAAATSSGWSGLVSSIRWASSTRSSIIAGGDRADGMGSGKGIISDKAGGADDGAVKRVEAAAGSSFPTLSGATTSGSPPERTELAGGASRQASQGRDLEHEASVRPGATGWVAGGETSATKSEPARSGKSGEVVGAGSSASGSGAERGEAGGDWQAGQQEGSQVVGEDWDAAPDDLTGGEMAAAVLGGMVAGAAVIEGPAEERSEQRR